MIPHRADNFGTYFVTTSTWNKRSLFQVDEMAKLLIETLYRYRKEGKYLLHEFVIMPDHFHALITPTGITLERAMQLIKGGYSYAVRQTGRTSLEIWQKGFSDHRVRDVSDFNQHRSYILQNPVRKRLSSMPQEYAWSSAANYDLDEVPQRLKPQFSPTDTARLKPCPYETRPGEE